MSNKASPELLRTLLRYEPETGCFFWRRRMDGYGHSKNSISIWNTKFAGKEAFKTPQSAGYVRGCVFAQYYLAHRVAWAIVHGRWPTIAIDHINGNRRDNRLANLREVTISENSRNGSLPAANKSGRIGVRFLESTQVWVANITVNRTLKYLGCSKDFDEACAMRAAAEVTYGFHPNHGRATQQLPA